MRRLWLALALLLAAPASAEVLVINAEGARACERWADAGLVDGVVAVGLLDSNLATGYHACPRTEVALGARASASIDRPNFYGNLGVDGVLAASVAIAGRGEVSLYVPFVSWQFAQNATLTGTVVGIGAVSIGGSFLALERRRVALSPYARLLLPTDARSFGAEAGLSLLVQAHHKLALHFVAGGDVTLGVAAATPGARGGALVVAGLDWTPARWFALDVDLDLHLGRSGALDWFAPAAALRFRLYRGLGLELATVVPVAGGDRHDVALLLKLGVRL